MGVIALVLSVVTASVSCKGETEDDDAPSGPVAVDDFSQRFAASYCSSIQGCCQRFGEPFELSSCQQTLSAYLAAALSTQTSNPRIVFDETVAGPCIDGYASMLSACTVRSEDAEDACDGLFRGTVPPGGACGESEECVQAPDQYVSCDTGVCVVEEESVSQYDLEPAALGEPCSGTCQGTPGESSSCGGASTPRPDAGACWTSDGLVCGSAGTCVAAPRAGEPCASFYCGAGAYCSGTTCVAATSDGPCTSPSACLETSYCDYDAGQCVPKKADGAACDSSEECIGGDCEADRCRVWSVASATSCAGLLDD